MADASVKPKRVLVIMWNNWIQLQRDDVARAFLDYENFEGEKQQQKWHIRG